MINGQIDMDALLESALMGIPTIDPKTGSGGSLPLVFGVPEEEVLEQRRVPSLRVLYQYDTSLADMRRVQDMPRLLRPVAPGHLEVGWLILRPPLFRRLSYQLDLYTYSYRDMLELTRQLFMRLRREYGFLVDDDGNEIIYRCETLTDMARAIDEERLFKRSFNFSFDAWVLEDDTPIGTVGRVDRIHIDYRDGQDQQLENEWVLDPPPTGIDIDSQALFILQALSAQGASTQQEEANP